MDENAYSAFLESKIKDEHAYTHLLEDEVRSLKEKISKLLKDISVVRKSENDLKMRSRQAEEKIAQLQMELKRAKEVKNIKAKQSTQKRIKQEKQQAEEIDGKQIFKSYLDNTFPRNKGIIKKLLKVFYILEERQNKQPLQKIKFYEVIFEGFMKRLLQWIFPKKTQTEKAQTIAQNLIKEWKEKEKIDRKELDKTNVSILKEREYIDKIEKIQAEMMMLRSSKSMVESRLKTYEKSLQIKGGQFIVNLKKMLQEDKQQEPQAHQKIQQILDLFTNAARTHESKNEEKKEEGTISILQQVPLILADKTQGGSKRKAAPVLKKNIYGYYQQPQFAGNYTLSVPTRHSNPNKQTQTLPQDLCVLTLHPVILLTLIDGTIKPQRTRHSSQYFVRIKINDQNQVESTVRESLQPIWNEPYLLKDYDFPFINVALMHKSKGLRDYSIGNGRLSASREEEKIVNIRKEKEFQGRVRFSLTYPKGNIYQFKITSVRLQIPSDKVILKEEVTIKFPYNPCISLQFVMPEKNIYIEKSMVILESSEESMSASLSKAEIKGELPLKQFIGKEGNKEVVVDIDNWKVIIQGEIYLLICQDEEPQVIGEELLEGGKGKYFSVRAPPPIITVAYGGILLHSNIKFPLVFNLKQDLNRLNIVKEMPNREITEQIVDPITINGCLKLSEFIKAPSKIYKFFIQTLQGEQVHLKHESHLFERLLKEIHLQVSYKEDEVQEIDYARKNRKDKEKNYKQFTIESKDLMLNHYKIFSKHFKRIGFVKFKLGYTIYDNELLYQNIDLPIKDSRRLQPLRQGTYFIELELSEAHLSSKSSGSTYRCVINGQNSSEKKGNHPEWKETFIIQFEFQEVFEVNVAYEVWEESSFGKTKIYEGKLIIDQKAMGLGAAIVSLDQSHQDCLHFGKISVPTEMIRLSIGQIEAQIKEEADWIGKIDPYIVLSSKGRQLIKTQYIDSKGSHPIWANINKQIIVARPQLQQQSQSEQSFLQCKLYDYDLIGRDDYLGQVKISSKLNPQLMNSGQSEIMYGNIVKDNMICGSIRLKGSFERVSQQKIRFGQRKKQKLNKNDGVYRVSLYRINIDNWKDYKDEKGFIVIKMNDKIIKEKQFEFNEVVLQKLQLTLWIVNSQTISVQIKRQFKRFFKTYIQSLGNFTITTSGKQLIIDKSTIKTQKNQAIGECLWYSELQDQMRYASFATFTSCKHQIISKSDLSHQLSFSSLLEGITQPYVFYHKRLSYHVKINDKQMELLCKDIGKDVYGLYLEESDHKNVVCYFTADLSNSIQTKLQERSERTKIGQSRQYKQLTSIHWQPFQYEPTTAYQFNLKFNATDEKITLKQQLSQLYNDYLVIKPYSIPVIFNTNNTPSSIEIINSKTKQIQATTNVQHFTKMFIPNKGALYYKIDDYNLKSIMELHFKYLLIRMRDIQKFKESHNVRLNISSALSLNTFSYQFMPQINSFLLQDIRLLIAQPPHSATTFFFQAQIVGQDSRSLMKFKFGFRLQTNKEQYRIVNHEDYIIHSFFSCILIDRNYEAPIRQDNTIYGMSFIDIKEIQFQVNEDPSRRNLFLQISLANQYQRLYLQRIEGTNMCKSQLSSVFFIQRTSIANFNIIEEGVLSNSALGAASFAFSQTYITKQTVSVYCEVIKDKRIIGRLSIKYNNLKQIPFLDINMFTYISRSNVAMVAELQQFGPNKEKYQKMTLTSRGDVARLQSQDSFIVTKDPRDYEITINERDTNKLLGQFKLCHELKTVGDRFTVLQPLRTSMNSLNGVLIIEYQSKQSNAITFEQNKDKKTQLIQLLVSKLTFKKHYSRLSDNFSVRMRTALRQNKSKMSPISKPTQANFIPFFLYNNQPCEIALLDKSDIIGSCNITPPYFDNEQRILNFTKDSKHVGIFLLKVTYPKQAETYTKMREITSIQASNLIDTQTFSKMTPFIELESINRRICYATQLGLGKEKIFWRVNLITADQIKLIVKDKDMFFDDVIGSAVLNMIEQQQIEDKTYELALLSQQQENRKQGNGILKVYTSPITAKLDTQSIITESFTQVKCYLLQLGGLTNSQLLKTANSIDISLSIGEGRVTLLKETYDDVYYYLSNKDVQVQFDTYSSQKKKEDFEIYVNIYKNNESIIEQKISNKGEKGKSGLFAICNLMPLEKEFHYFTKIYMWLIQKIPQNLQIFIKTHNHFEQLRIVTYQKYLLIVQPYQLSSSINPNHPITLIMRQGTDIVVQYDININQNMLNANKSILSGAITNRQKDIGFFYTQISKFVSKGQKYERKINIGKSRRKWLNLCICEANLTKDLEIFSKMDPYCKFGPTNSKKNWRSTKVQDNIGQHPIWNQSFFLQLIAQQTQELSFVVMDEQVTLDRAIGEGKILMNELLDSQSVIKEVQLFYKSDESSGKLKVLPKVTTTYIIFRNKSTYEEECPFYLFNQNNKEGEKGVEIQLGMAYPIDSSKQIRIKHKDTIKAMTNISLKQQKIQGLSFGSEGGWLLYDIYE